MIFFTLGTHQPFDRMVALVDRWCAANPGQEVLGQIPEPGRDGYTPRHFTWVTQVHPEEYARIIKRSDFIVAHAGMGTIISALCASKRIVIFPRLAALMEQRNDHQIATARRLLGRPGLTAAFDEAEFLAALDRLADEDPSEAAVPLGSFAQRELTDRLRQEILVSGGQRKGRASRVETAREPVGIERFGLRRLLGASRP